MWRRRRSEAPKEPFLMAALLEVDAGESSEDLQAEIDRAGRDAVDEAGGVLVFSRMNPDSERPATLIGSFGFRVDDRLAVAALEGWTQEVARRAPAARMLRRYVRGAELHREWCDPAFQKEVERDSGAPELG